MGEKPVENGRFIVRMLGGFSVYYGERPIVSERSRNSKVTQLLEYLLMNRRRGVRQDRGPVGRGGKREPRQRVEKSHLPPEEAVYRSRFTGG